LARAWRTLPWALSLSAASAALALPAAAQNLDAGKSPAQIFSEDCATCHRSVRDFRNGVSASFLREHYTTSSEMASTMAAYLSGARADPRPSPAGRQPASPATAAREPAAPEPQREPKRAQQGADPKAAAASQAASRNRPATARADTSKPAETKPPAEPPQPAPALEEFEE
jgi:hypothetical protein